MDDMVLTARLDDATIIYISPIGAETYSEYVDEDNLGGEAGFFVLRSSNDGRAQRFEILAKATSFEAAADLFDMIVRGRQSARAAGR